MFVTFSAWSALHCSVWLLLATKWGVRVGAAWRMTQGYATRTYRQFILVAGGPGWISGAMSQKNPNNWREDASKRPQLHLLKNIFPIALEDRICSERSSHALQMDKYWLFMAKVLTVRMLWMKYQTRHSMQVLRFPVVSRVTGLPRSTLYLYMKNNQFPKPMKLGVRSVGWIKEEVDEWLQQRSNSRSLWWTSCFSRVNFWLAGAVI